MTYILPDDYVVNQRLNDSPNSCNSADDASKHTRKSPKPTKNELRILTAEEAAREIAQHGGMALGKVTRQGQGADQTYKTSCPVHGGGDANCSVADGRDGKLLFHCFSHDCDSTEIAKAVENMGIAVHGSDQSRARTSKSKPLKPKQNKAKAAKKEPQPEPVFEAPANVPAFERPPKYSQHWTYNDEAGNPIAHAVRRDTKDGKEIRPVTLWREPNGNLAWKWKGHPSGSRVMFNLDQITNRADEPLMFVEGEKDATGATRYDFTTGYVLTTTPNGSGSADTADTSPMAARDIVVWPDNDKPGIKYADSIVKAARKHGASSVRIVKYPDGIFPDEWGLADPLPEGIDEAFLIDMLANAEVVFDRAAADGAGAVPQTDRAAGGFEFRGSLPPGFSRHDGYIWRVTGKDEETGELTEIKVCTAFEVIGRSRSEMGTGHGLVIRHSDPFGEVTELAIPMESIAGNGEALRATLADIGIQVVPTSSTRTQFHLFIHELSQLETLPEYTSCEQTGWSDGAFAMPDKTIGVRGDGRRLIYQSNSPSRVKLRSNGDVADWISGVARLATGNAQFMTAINLSFAAPLSRMTSATTGFAIHYFGPSSTGKTTMLLGGASVFGKPTDVIKPWTGTSNGHEANAAAWNDLPMCLDELHNAPPRIGEVIYRMANGEGKQRSSRNGTIKAAPSWRTLIVSTGELTLAEQAAKTGEKLMGGMSARFVDIEVNGEHGAWNDLHGCQNGAELSDLVRENSDKHHGAVGLAWLEFLASDFNSVCAVIRAAQDRFVTERMPDGADPQIRRVCEHFGLIAAAGEMASENKLTGWKTGEAWDSAVEVFEGYLKSRHGGRRSPDEITVLKQIEHLLDVKGDHFPRPGVAPPAGKEPWGFESYDKKYGDLIAFTTPGFNEAFSNTSPSMAARTMDRLGLLVPADGENLNTKHTLAVRGSNSKYGTRKRFYLLIESRFRSLIE
jgi:putative DNA primase/helicase